METLNRIDIQTTATGLSSNLCSLPVRYACFFFYYLATIQQNQCDKLSHCYFYPAESQRIQKGKPGNQEEEVEVMQARNRILSESAIT